MEIVPGFSAGNWLWKAFHLQDQALSLELIVINLQAVWISCLNSKIFELFEIIFLNSREKPLRIDIPVI